MSSFSVISARSQTAGRGQRGNIWLSEPDKNLTFSIVVKYEGGLFSHMSAAEQIIITEITSLTIVELLSNYGIDAKIKWPNDIYVNDKKICGILIEHSVCKASLVHSIIGVGLNVNQLDFDKSLANPTSILLEKGGEELHLPLLLDELLDIFQKYASQYSQDELHNLYHSKLFFAASSGPDYPQSQ